MKMTRSLFLLSGIFALAQSAQASVIFTITPISSTVADITATGSFDAATPSLRPSRIAFLSTGANGSLTSLYSSQGSTAAWTLQGTLPGASTLQTSGGGILSTANASVGSFTGGQNKIVFTITSNPAAGQTISGTISGLTLPAGFTWGTVGATGSVAYGQNNSGNSITNTGTWVIAAASGSAAPEPGTLAFLALGGTLTLVARRRRA